MHTIPLRAPILTALSAVLLSAAMLTSATAAADTKLSGEAIASAVSGHSYQGSMSAPGSGFNEYYAPDGTIHGQGYTGNWTTREGEMCFDYGEDTTCYQVSIDGPSMVLRQDGTIKGNGMLIEGNTVN